MNGKDGQSVTTDSSAEQDIGIVYALTNETMPGLVKIGYTDRDNVQARMKELFSTGVPYPFVCLEAVRIDDYKNIERQLHRVFEPDRYYQKREFFEVSVEQVQALFSLLKGEDAKPDIEQGIEEAITPGLTGRKRQPNTYLSDLGIPDGAELKFVGRARDTGSITAIVVSAASNRLKLKEDNAADISASADDDTYEDYSFSRLTAILLGGKSKSVPRWDYWQYKGELLSVRRDNAFNSEG